MEEFNGVCLIFVECLCVVFIGECVDGFLFDVVEVDGFFEGFVVVFSVCVDD